MKSLSLFVLLLLPIAGFADFTPIRSSDDSRLIYVSDSEGSDRNKCLSPEKPCKTLDAALGKMRPGFPDHVYLKRGDVWRNQTLSRVASGRSAKEPAVIAYYGQGPRPVIEHEDNLLHTVNEPIENVHFIGLKFYSYKMDPKNPAFAGGEKDHKGNIVMVGGLANILFEDSLFHFVELIAHSHKGSTLKNLRLNRNIFHGSYYNRSAFDRNSRPSNIYISSVEGLQLTENVFYLGGWHPDVAGAAANMFNHCAYINYGNSGHGLIVRGNVFASCASHGVHGRPGGLYENNFFARSAVSLQMGYRGHPLPAGVKAQAFGNVITEGESMVKGDKACSNRAVCTPALWGLETDEPGEADFEIRDNIVALRSPTANGQTVFKNLISKDIQFQPGSDKGGNIIYRWKTPEQGTDRKYPDPGRTLADYHAALGGERDYHAAMAALTQRPLGRWDELMHAAAINAYIRQGFGATLPGDEKYLALPPLSNPKSSPKGP